MNTIHGLGMEIDFEEEPGTTGTCRRPTKIPPKKRSSHPVKSTAHGNLGHKLGKTHETVIELSLAHLVDLAHLIAH